MNVPIYKLTQTQEGWQVAFAFQVFHRQADEWLKMRWGFNAGVLLEEALDRYKLFIESQVVNEIEFYTGTMPSNTLIMRGVHLPELGLQMALIGKSKASNKEQAQETAQQYAREVSSTFPYDFILMPAETEADYNRLNGEQLLTKNSNVVQIRRGMIPLPTAHGLRYLMGLWQASSRSNEQIWRALSAMPQAALYNIAIQPSVLYAAEKQVLLDIKKSISDPEQTNETISAYIPWAKNHIERRLAVLKKFFLVQIHLVTDGEVGNLFRSVGSALTRDSDNLALPGYQTLYPSSTSERQQWCESMRSLELIPNSSRLDDLADLDEIFSVFRFPYRPEAGLPGANFIELKKESNQTQGKQKP